MTGIASSTGSVLQRAGQCFRGFFRRIRRRPAGLQMESWVVENVSRGGFGAVLGNVPGEWLKVGALIAMQPEGGDNWLVGVIRRYHRETENRCPGRYRGAGPAGRFGRTQSPRTASSYAAVAGMPALLLRRQQCGRANCASSCHYGSFDLRESARICRDGRRMPAGRRWPWSSRPPTTRWRAIGRAVLG
jgi:hypothetical protein